MKRKLAIYLAGTIRKAHEKADESYWTDEDLLFIKSNLPDYEISFLNPAVRTDNLSDQQSVFGRDMMQVFSSHLVFVDARDRRGLGVGAEMMWAKINKIPVMSWCPKNSHYHKTQTVILGVPVSDFIHPFVLSLSDKLVENLEEATRWIREFLFHPKTAIKGIEEIAQAMAHYHKEQLPVDLPMKELLECPELQKRMLRKLPKVIFNNENS